MIHMSVQQKTKKRLGTYGILLLVLLFVAICTWLTNGQPYITDEGEQAAVAGATFQQILMAPIAGFHDASEVIGFVFCLGAFLALVNAGEVIGFVFCLGAFLALVNATGALETGIHVLVKKLKGKELVLVWVLMFLFSVGGTTYGMGEETVGFYILLAATMTAAGMDPVVGAATVLLGAGSGVLGSTINPFATGAAVDAARSAGVEVNMGILYLEGVILWLGTYLISVVGVTKYARHVIETKGSILTADQLSECQKAYGNMEISDEEKLTGRQKVCMIIFALTFVVMILGFIPWGDLNESIADGLAWTSILTGKALGSWWFDDAATWFMLMGIIIGIVGMTDRSKMATTIISGIGDMVSVNVVIALARATAVLMSQTGLGSWMVQASVTALTQSGMPAALFGFLDYILILASASWCRLLPAWPRFPHRLFHQSFPASTGRWRPPLCATLQPMVL